MSKQKLKKELLGLTKEQLIEHVLSLYEKNKSVQEFYSFYLNPSNENELAKKYISIIKKEFNINNPERASLKFSIAKKAISDFKSLSPSAEGLANVMMTLPESACEFTYEYGDIGESFYIAACNNFDTTLKYIKQNNLLEQFKIRAEMCVKWASPCGYGFADDIEDIYSEYYES